MEARRHGLTVRSGGRNFEVSNGPLLVRFVYRDGGYAQEFHAINAKGEHRLVLSSIHKDIIPSSEHRVSDSPMISGARPHLFAVCRESLRMVFSNVQLNRTDSQSVVVRLSGSVQGNAVLMRLRISENSRCVHCEVENAFADPRPVIEYLMSSYAFLPGGRAFASREEPEFTWAPNLRPTSDAVIGDLAFHSPAAIVQHGRYGAALIPDLDLLARNRTMPASLDLDLMNGLLFAPLLSYGFCDYEPAAGGRYFRHDITLSRRLDTNRLTYGFDLIVDADCKRGSMAKQAARLLWSRYGSGGSERKLGASYAAGNPPQSPLRKGGSKTCPPPPKGSQVCSPPYEGGAGGGYLTSNAPASPPYEGGVGGGYLTNEAPGQKRMSFGATPGLTPDARTAYGLWTAGQRDEARAMRDAVLKAPERQGMFATRFDRSIGSWRRSGCPGGSDYYSSEECSDQMSWLLRMHQDLEPHPETLRRAQRYVDFLTDHRMRSGAVPTWYDAWMRPEAALRSAASTAVSALCTMRLARITGLKKHLAAAAAMARFVTTEAIAERMYLDSTCISADGFVSLRCADPHTGMHAESSQAMLWCADMCFEAYALFGDKAYLRTGVDVLDRLCLMQSVGEKSWMQAVHGVLARGNTDTRVAPVLTADFAYCAMRYGAATGSAEYCERAAAALRAAQVCAGRGSEEARVHAIAAVMEKEFGSLYVSLAGKWSVELNGCKVDRLEISGTRVALETEPEPVGARVVFSGLRARSYEVSINGRRGCYAREQMEAGISV